MPVINARVSLNDQVRVKLNDHGKRIFKLFHKELGLDPDLHFRCCNLDNENYITTELWNIMNIFGPHCYNGCKMPFDTTEIEFI